MSTTCPSLGDIILINLSPVSGHEQKGQRPAVVITQERFNKKTGLCIIAPITSNIKGYPFEVVVEANKTKGVILSDQIRSIDWNARKVNKVDSVSEYCLSEVREKVLLILS
jgi:mRNA interferase MazF